MAVTAIAASLVAFPEQRKVAGSGDPPPRIAERSVPAPTISTSYTHAALEEIERSFPPHTAAAIDVIVLAICCASGGIHHNDVERVYFVANSLQLAFDILRRTH